MQILQSFNSFPTLKGRWDQKGVLDDIIALTAFSFLSIRALGYNITLYADPLTMVKMRGAGIPAKPLPPYSKNSIWTDGKVYALSVHDGIFIHVDSDIVLKGAIFPPDFEVYVEHIEESSYAGSYLPQIKWFNQYLNGSNKLLDLGYSYNCGVFGIANADIKKSYLKRYEELKSIYLANEHSFKKMQGTGHYEPCIVIEQYALADMAAKEGFDVHTLLPSTDDEYNAEYANCIGYNHLKGKIKYKPDVIDFYRNDFKENFPKEYSKILI